MLGASEGSNYLIKFGNYSAPTGLLIIAWGNAPGAAGLLIIAWGNAPGVYDCSQGVALGFNKAPFQG